MKIWYEGEEKKDAHQKMQELLKIMFHLSNFQKNQTSGTSDICVKNADT